MTYTIVFHICKKRCPYCKKRAISRALISHSTARHCQIFCDACHQRAKFSNRYLFTLTEKILSILNHFIPHNLFLNSIGISDAPVLWICYLISSRFTTLKKINPFNPKRYQRLRYWKIKRAKMGYTMTHYCEETAFMSKKDQTPPPKYRWKNGQWRFQKSLSSEIRNTIHHQE